MLRQKEAKTPAKYAIYGFDTENDPITGNFKFGYVVRPSGSKVYFSNRIDMAEYLQRRHETPKGYYSRPIMCAMNVSYDLGVIGIDAFLWNQRSWDGRFITCKPVPVTRNQKTGAITIDKGKLAEWKVIDKENGKTRKKYKKEGKKLPKQLRNNGRDNFERGRFIFVDLSNFFQGIGLKGLAEKWGVEYIDIHDWKDERILDACYSHANSGRIVLTKVQALLHEKFNAQLEITAATTFMNLFLRDFLRKEDEIINPLFDKSRGHKNFNLRQNLLWREINEYTDKWGKKTFKSELYDAINKNWTGLCYKGGWVDVLLKNERHVCAIDITSSYPFQMRTYPMPDMTIDGFVGGIEWDGCTNEKFEKILKKYEGAAKVTMKTPKNCYLPFLLSTVEYDKNKIKTMVGLTGNIIGHYTFPEIRYALEIGYKLVEVEQYYVCKRKIGMFDAYVDTMFALKQEKQTKELGKLGLNSLSGKFGQRKDDNTAQIKIILENQQDIDPEDVFSFGETMFYHERSKEHPEDFHQRAYPLLIAYITGYGRIQLHKTITIIGVKKVCYWDTDSIMFVIENLEDMQKILQNVDVGKHLGGWDIKWRGVFEARGNKYYRYKPDGEKKWIYHIKGIPEENREEYWRTNFAGKMQPIKYRQFMRRLKQLGLGKTSDDYQLGQWLHVNKIDTQPPDKRHFNFDGSSRPYKTGEAKAMFYMHSKTIQEGIKSWLKLEKREEIKE